MMRAIPIHLDVKSPLLRKRPRFRADNRVVDKKGNTGQNPPCRVPGGGCGR